MLIQRTDHEGNIIEEVEMTDRGAFHFFLSVDERRYIFFPRHIPPQIFEVHPNENPINPRDPSFKFG